MTTARYEAALEAFAQGGNRYAKIPELTACGKAAGLTAEEIIGDARAHGVTDRDADIRRMFAGSKADPHGNRRAFAPRFNGRSYGMKPPERKTYPTEVRDMIALGRAVSTSADLMQLSPVPTADLHGADAARALLAAMFKPTDLILVGTMRRGVDERNLRPAADWMTDPNLTAWEQVKINPFTGDEAEGGSKGLTRIGEKCLARYPLMLLEFDELALADQVRFWSGMVGHGMPIVAIVYSGGKSLHGLIRVGAADERTWWRRCEDARVHYCADPEAAYRADVQALRPAAGVRLAGAIRHGEDGKKPREQRLLYLAPEAGIVRGAQKRPVGREDEKAVNPPPETSGAIVARPDAPYAPPFRCADCKTAADCKQAFGKYWQDKSGGGIGCVHPFAYAKLEKPKPEGWKT